MPTEDIAGVATLTFTATGNCEFVPMDVAGEAALAFTASGGLDEIVNTLGPRADGYPPNRGSGRSAVAEAVAVGSRSAIGVAGAVEE